MNGYGNRLEGVADFEDDDPGDIGVMGRRRRGTILGSINNGALGGRVTANDGDLHVAGGLSHGVADRAELEPAAI